MSIPHEVTIHTCQIFRWGVRLCGTYLIIRWLRWCFTCLRAPGVGFWRYAASCAGWYLFGDRSLRRAHRCRYCKRPMRTLAWKKHDGFCSKRCSKWWRKESRQIIRHDNRCMRHPFCRITHAGVCLWCTADAWRASHPIPAATHRWWLMLHGFRWVPTFQDDSGNTLAAPGAAFDAMLQSHGVRWCTYVKFYRSRRGRVSPLVVGKTGSGLVNATGTDLSFSTDPSHGPARRMLAATRARWHTTYVMVKGAKNANAAYDTERMVMDHLSLYGS